jgi:hypothetical protein
LIARLLARCLRTIPYNPICLPVRSAGSSFSQKQGIHHV